LELFAKAVLPRFAERAETRDAERKNRLAAALGAIGDVEIVREYVKAYRRAGVSLPAVRPIGFPDAIHCRPTLEALAR
jgi:hypothetical protein